MKYIALILITLSFIRCSDKNTKKNKDTLASKNKFQIKKTHKHSPWKELNFRGYYTVKCPVEWKVSRDRSRVFIRPEQNRPIGVVIGMETDKSLNALSLSKYFVHFYKNILTPRGIRVKNLEQTRLSGLNAAQFEYRFKNDSGQILRGFEILVKYKGRFFYFVAEAPEKEFESYFIKFKFIIDSVEFPGTDKG